MTSPAVEVKKKWKNLRSSFVREKRITPSGSSGGKKKEWIYMQCLSFLAGHVKEKKKTYSNFSAPNIEVPPNIDFNTDMETPSTFVNEEEVRVLQSRGDLGVIDGEPFDFSQLEEYINDDSENNIYFHDALVTSSDLKLSEGPEKAYVRNGLPKEALAAGATEGHGQGPAGRCVVQAAVDPAHSPQTSPQQKSYALHLARTNTSDVTSSFNKPHHLPDSPPDSGSEPPFSPPNEDPKLKCSPVEMLPHHHHHHLAQTTDLTGPEVLKHSYMGYGHMLQPLKHTPDISSSTSPTSSSPHHHHARHQSSASPVPVHSTHSTSMPVLSPNSSGSLAGQLLTQIPLSSFVANPLQQQLLASGNPHLGHLYAGSEEFLYENLANPVSSTTNNKKRKLPDSPKMQRNHQNNNCVQVKIEPTISSPDPITTVLPSGDEDYNFDLGSAEGNGIFVDSSFQCIRFQPFQQNTWAQLLDKDMKEIVSPNYRVDADKGFNFSNADESFVCQKKNHFQVTVHIQPVADAHYVRTPDGTRVIEKFSLHFHGVKMESPTQTIKVEQSQSDRSKRPFHPVPLEMVPDQVTKTTVGRLHFSETTSNNMRKKGKPNPDQRFFFLVVSLCAHVAGDSPATVVAHSSEKIIVRASNPGQFENDMELSWQKGHTPDSIFHNGRVGINTDRPEESLVVHGNIKVTGHILQPSDFRAKYDIHELDTREQLKNVANLRIVRYRYLPDFSSHVGLSQMTDTGVIAQEVQHVLPEAVIEAGDVLLKDGQLIEKLLVVNKERIFMENVGAVKELCKVTDNLENRIDELERINRKLSSMKRKDSLKSTSTEVSRMSSVLSHGKKRCHRACGKRHRGEELPSCSSHFIQSSIIVLVVIMFCCLIFLATLNIMEWQSRRGSAHIKRAVLIQMKSSSDNATHRDKAAVLTTLFPSSTLSSQSSLEDSRSASDVFPKLSTKLPIRVSSPAHQVTGPDDVFGHDIDCSVEECPVFCCDHPKDFHQDEDALPFPSQSEDNSVRLNVEKKSGGRFMVDDHTFIPKMERKLSELPASTEERAHKLSKRIVDPEDEETENSQVFRTDEHSDLSLHLLELNATLLPELCSEDRSEETSAVYVFCNVYISRHFPHPNITLHIRFEDSESVVEYCGGHHYLSCPREAMVDEKSHSTHTIKKRKVIPQSRSFQLPVGSFITSRYRFRMMSRRFNTDQQVCSLSPNYRPFTEYVITFQRRCDK